MHLILSMPQISFFLGIIIRMFYRDHNPPHFHAIYGEYEGLIDINQRQFASTGLEFSKYYLELTRILP